MARRANPTPQTQNPGGKSKAMAEVLASTNTSQIRTATFLKEKFSVDSSESGMEVERSGFIRGHGVAASVRWPCGSVVSGV